MKKTINNFHCSNHGYVDFIPHCSICVKELEASIRKKVVEDILKITSKSYSIEETYGKEIKEYALSVGITLK